MNHDIYDRVANGDAEEMPPIAPAKSERVAKPVREFVTLNAAEIAKPLPPVHYLVDALGIGVGAPVLVCGYGFSGKTIACQDLALSVASGTDFLGIYRVRKGLVLHLDYEQGERITRERYQRLARAKNIDLDALGDMLKIAVHPAIRVNDDDAADALTRVLAGVTLCIVDSLRACAPGVDENSSEIREVIDLANRVGEKTKTTIVFVHHARKPSNDANADPTFAIRGSSGIFDAAGSAFVFQGTKGGPVTVHHQKCRNRGTLVDSFGLAIEDVEVDAIAKGGVRVRHLDALEMVARTPVSAVYSGTMSLITDFLRASGGEYRGSKTGLGKNIRVSSSDYFAAFEELKSNGQLTYGKDAMGQFVRLTTDRDDTSGLPEASGSASEDTSTSDP